MTIAAGTINYQLGTAPVTGCGFSSFSWSK